MVFKIKTAALLMGLGLFISCTDDAPKVTEPVQDAQAPMADMPVSTPGAETPDFASSTIFFAYDDYSLTTEAQSELSRIGEYMKSNTSAVVQVEGHCDERGTVEYNLALGERRAQSVKSYLVNLGVTDARLSTISYGEEKPAVEGHDESSWVKNRRAAFVLTVK